MTNTLNTLLAKLPDELAKKIPDVKLRDQDINEVLAQKTFTEENLLPARLDLAGFSLSFEASGEARVTNFNSPGDKDDNGIVGDAPKPDAAASDTLSPQLVLGDQRGWMRYQLSARLKAAANAPFPFLGASAEAEARAMLADYRAHPLDESMRDAARADLGKSLRLAVVDTHLRQLGVGDAMAVQVRGTLKASVELKWADVFTANLAALSFVRGGEVVALKTSLGATLSASVSLADDFLVAFSRPQTGKIQIAVRKARSREVTGSAGLEPTVSFADQDAVRKRLGDVLTALAGKPMAQVDEWVEKAGKHQLSEDQKALLEQVLERLGLDPKLADLTTLKTRWEEFKTSVEGKLDTVAKAKVSAGFRYEYLRIAQSSTLLEVVVDEDQAVAFHGRLIRGDLVQALDWLRDPAHAGQFELKNFLRQSTLSQQRSMTLGIGFGSWDLLRSTNTRKQVWSTQENFQGGRRLAYLGSRTYEDTLLGNRGRWVADFQAEMPAFAQPATAASFEYGLHFVLWGQQKKLSRQELLQAVDDAIVWRVLDDADEATVLQALEAHLDKGQIETQLELKLHHDTLRAVMAKLQSPDTALPLFARALARAMPWSELRPRSNVEVRRIVYTPVWEMYFEQLRHMGSALHGDLPPTKVAQDAAWRLQKDPIGKELYLREKDFQAGGNFSFAEMTFKNPGTLAKCHSFIDGMVRLSRALNGGGNPSELEKVFSDLEPMWNTGFHLRAVGALLAELGLATPKGATGGVERTFTVRLASSGEQLAFTTARNSGGVTP